MSLVVHREEILRQLHKKYKSVVSYPSCHVRALDGAHKDRPNGTVVNFSLKRVMNCSTPPASINDGCHHSGLHTFSRSGYRLQYSYG